MHSLCQCHICNLQSRCPSAMMCRSQVNFCMQVHSFNQSIGELRGALEKEYKNVQVSRVSM